MASTQWIEATNTLVLNDALYDKDRLQWRFNDNKTLEPNIWDAYKVFKSGMNVSETRGVIAITITHLSPVAAKQWVTLLVSDLNEWMKSKELILLSEKIGTVKNKIDNSSNEELKALLLQRIEVQYKKKILIEEEDDFVLKTIDAAQVAKEKSGPRRAVMCVLATLLGCIFGVVIVLFRFFFVKKESVKDLS